ncbi:MAG: hypothetical protein J6P16_06575 [Eubacterium sp.]|nr:hypothetical protein [Eubacterium sp.]
MLKRTHDKIYAMFEKAGGYLPTRELLDKGISTIHIKELLMDRDIEKVSHGNYWGSFLNKEKPEKYKFIEACMTNKKAVICGPSACYYHGLLKKEPPVLYVATARTDRSGMKLMFPVSRHYYSKTTFDKYMDTYMESGMKVRVYNIDRSVVDCIRMREDIGEEILGEIIESYSKSEKKNTGDLLSYADDMRVGQIVRTRLKL